MRVPAVLIAALLCTPALAGTRQGFFEGKDAYDAHQWAKATAELQGALDAPSDLKKKERPEAAYLLGRAWLGRLEEEVQNPEVRYEAPLRAVEAFVLARSLERDPWAERAQTELGILAPRLNRVATVAMDEAGRQAEGSVERAQALRMATEYLRASQTADPTKHEAPLLLGFASWQAGNPDEARQAWTEAVSRYESHPENGPDPGIVGAFSSHASSLGLFQGEDPETALALCDQGIALIQRELGREGDDPVVRQAWVDGKRQLEALRLDVLVRHAGYRERALKELATLEASEPSNVLVRVVHAGLLETTGDPAGARALYDDALTIDPDHAAAHAGMGRLLFAEATALLRQASEESGDTAALQTRAVALMNEARPHLEAVVAKDRTDLSALMGLRQIAGFTGDVEGMNRWKAAIEAVQAGRTW